MTRKLIAALFLAALARLVVSGIPPVLDPTEGRYAEIAEEMAVTGDWVTPRVWINGEHVPFLGKPPLFFWTVASSIKVFGATEFAVRLPSFVGGAALLILVYIVISRYFGGKTAATATLMTATSAIFFFLSGSVVLDMHLAFFVSGSLLAYLAFALENDIQIRKRWSISVFALLAGGFLTKGPVAVILFGLPVFTWSLWRKRLGLLKHHTWWIGIPLFAVLVIPWFALAEARNPGFLQYFFVNENILRYLRPDYGDLYGTGHQFPRGSAIPFFVLAALPWSIVAAWLVVKRRWTGFREMMRDDAQSFFFFSFSSSVTFWCFARQLLPTYMVPMIPMLTAWIAVGVRDSEVESRSGTRLALATVAVWFTLLFLAIPVASGDSTRAILREAHRVAWELNIPDEVTFAHSTSQSAFFYSRGKVDTHPENNSRSTVERLLQTGERRLLIIRQDQLDEVPGNLLDRLLPVGRSNGWFLYVTRISNTTE